MVQLSTPGEFLQAGAVAVSGSTYVDARKTTQALHNSLKDVENVARKLDIQMYIKLPILAVA